MSLHLDENTFLDFDSSTIMDEQCDPLTLVETMGRPSILRRSQKENLPPKSSLKPPKLSFQTPVRDPVTHKVLGAHLTNKLDGNIAVEEAGKNEEKVSETGSSGSLNVTEEKGNEDSGGTSEVVGSNVGPEMLLKPSINETTASDAGLGDEDQISSKGTYALDFDMLDAINPFQGMSKVLSSPAKKLSDSELDCQEQCVNDQTLLKKAEQMPEVTSCNSNAEHGINASADIFSQVESQSNNTEQDTEMIQSQTSCNFEEDGLEKIDSCASEMTVQMSQLPPKDSDNLDFDNIDSINPFQMGEPEHKNSPPPGQDILSLNMKKDHAVKLEIGFNDIVKGGKKPPLKKLGKRPGGRLLKKPSVTTEKTARSKSEKPSKEVVKPKTDPLVSKTMHNVEWDKLDEPNFNPFGGGSKIGNSPSSAKLPAANSDELLSLQDTVKNVEPIAKEVDEVQKPTSFSQTDNTSGVPTAAVKQTAKRNTCKVEPIMEVSAVPFMQDPVPSPNDGNVETRLLSSFERTVAYNARVQSPESDPEMLGMNGLDFSMPGTSAFLNAIIEGEAEEFRPADQIPAFNQPIEIDYLEQFGHSLFHVSTLRKQSLYLKFDPLLRESPVKLPVNPMEMQSGQSDPTASSIVDLDVRLITDQQSNEMDMMEMVSLATLIPDGQANLIDPVADFTSATVPAEGAIVELLKYSQKDMDAVKQEVTETITLEWKPQHEESLAQCAEMKKIVNDYSEMTVQLMVVAGKDNELAKVQLEKVTEEKQQALKELNSIENSFSDLFKRFEKRKEAIEGFRKNEESLKTCAQNYIARIKKEEERYQALKGHAEEKLNQANEEIAQVRSKNAALQAQLRKEQMKSNYMERSLVEKDKQNVELLKICDELIAKMEKI